MSSLGRYTVQEGRQTRENLTSPVLNVQSVMSVLAKNKEECQGSDDMLQSLGLEQQDIGTEINMRTRN